jgi:dephospho-CoA kinase
VLKIGITGGIGSGKSTVCSVFKALGIPVYNADERARYLIETDKDIKQQIIKVFGAKAFIDNVYNKKFIADLVFNDSNLLEKLNFIIHPHVSIDFKNWSNQFADAKYIIEEAAILFESGANKKMDYVIFVDAPLELRLDRVINRDKSKRSEVLKRIKHQWSADKIRQLADWSIVNNNKKLILPQILNIHNCLTKLTLVNE